MGILQRNRICTILIGALRAVALLCATGTIMQAFLASLGFSSEYLYIHSSITQAANVLTIAACSRWADTGVIRKTALVQLPHAVLYLCYIPLCLWRTASLFSFAMLTGICLLQSVCIALYTVCEYKLPYYIYTPQDYGPLAAIGGIISSLLSLLTGVLISWLNAVLSYAVLMLAACIVSAVLMLCGFLLTCLLRPITEEAPITPAPEKKRIPLTEILRYPVFRNLIPANLFRGFSAGTTAVMAAIALDLGYSEGIVTAMVSVQALATLLGCGIFGASTRFVSPRVTLLAGSAAFLLLPLVLLRSDALFLAVFFVLLFGRTCVDYSVPTVLRFAVPAQIAGPYNAWRMILQNGGTLIATTVAAFIPTQWLLILTVLFQILFALHYFLARELRHTV